MSGALDAGADDEIFADCDDISFDLRPPDSLAGGFLRFGLTGMSQIHAEFFRNELIWRVISLLVTPNAKWSVILGIDFPHKHSCNIRFDPKTTSMVLEPVTRTVNVDAITLIPPPG